MNMEIGSGMRSVTPKLSETSLESGAPIATDKPSGLSGTDSGELSALQNSCQALTGGAKTALDKIPSPAGSGTSSSLSGALEKLGEASFTTDLYSIMALLQKSAQDMRDTARIERNSELQAQISALDSAAEQMKIAADWKLAAGIVQGVASIGAGLAQAGSGLTQMGTSAGSGIIGLKGIGSDGKISDRADQGSKLVSGLGTGFSQIQGAGGTLISGAGSIVSSALTYQADLAEAQKTRLETDAKEHETAAQHASDWMQEMMEVIRDIKDNTKTANQMNHESISGITRNV